MNKSEILKDYETICICNGKMQGAWSGDAYNDGVVADLYSTNMIVMAHKYDVPIPAIEDYDDEEEYPHHYQRIEARATDIFWALQAKLKDLILE